MNPDESEEVTYEYECSLCEAAYSLILKEGFLKEEAYHCPFCGEYQLRE
jgi:DNA-directed RNA polymerase subunit RPC12/RpoP